MKLSDTEYLAVEGMNGQAFGKDDEYSKGGSIKRFAEIGGRVGVLRDSRNPQAILGYYLSSEHKGITDLVRYAVHPNHKGRGLAKKVLQEFWKDVIYATTYVSTSNRESFHALLSSGFRYFTATQHFIYLVGLKT